MTFLHPMIVCITLLLLQSQALGDTLGEALEAALEKDPRIVAEKIKVDIAEESVVRAKAANQFEINLSGSAGYEWIDTDSTARGTLNADGSIVRETSTLQAEANYPLYAGGRLANLIKQSTIAHALAKSQFSRVVQDIHLQVVTVYVDVLFNRETVKIRESNVDALVEQLEGAKARISLGVATNADIALAEARLSRAIASLAGVQSQLEISKVNYQALIGDTAIELAELPPLPSMPASLEEAIELAFSNAPEILIARHAVTNAVVSVEIAKALTRPEISLSLGAGLQNSYKDEIQSESVTALIRGRIPLYRGGANNSSLRTAQLTKKQALRSFDAVAWELRTDVSQAWYQYQASTRMVNASEAQVRASEIAFVSSTKEFQAGIRSTLDVLNQEQEFLESRLSNLRSNYDAYLNAHKLLRTIGSLKTDSVTR